MFFFNQTLSRKKRGFISLNPEGFDLRPRNLTGFTLIELLVVVAIIGVLVTLATLGLNSLRTKSRDTKRISDVRQIQEALEIYNNSNSGYPTTITPGNALVDPGGVTYMNKIPNNPTPWVEGACTSGADYTYTSANTTTYNLAYCLARTIQDVPAGNIIAVPNSINGGQTAQSTCPSYGAYYKNITVTNNDASVTLTNFQIEVDLDTTAMVSGGHLRSDGNDLRITSSDCLTSYAFWLEPGTINTATTRLWVKIPSLAPSTAVVLKMHYGTQTTSVSDASTTFIYYDNSGVAGSYNMGSQLDYFVEGHTSAASLVIGAFGESAAFHNHYRLWMPWSADSRIGSVVADVETARLTGKPLWSNYRFKLIVEQAGSSGNRAIFWLYNRDNSTVGFNDFFDNYLTLNSSNNWFYHPAWPWVAIGKYDDTLTGQPSSSVGTESSE